jgi:elongation factor G
VIDINDIRNVVLLGHGASGKTSLAETILHKTGATSRLGSVEDGSSVCDYDDEEKHRHNSIHSALVNASYGGKLINIIDAPGYPDFIGPALLSLVAVETAVVVVSAPSGIELNTRKLFEAATNAGLARIIVINKIDAENAELGELVNNLQQTFGMQCRCANLPAANKTTLIDCLVNDKGDSPVMDVAQAHTELVETIVEVDDALMERYLGGETIAPEQVAAAFSKAMLAGKIVPIIFANAKKEIGTTELLDLIVKFAPSPAAVKPAQLKVGDKVVEVKADKAGPLAGVVFRVGFDPRSNMKYTAIRLFSGTMKADSTIMRNDDKKGIRPGHIFRSQGIEHKELEAGIAGDIITLAKAEDLHMGDMINDGRLVGTFAMAPLPNPMFSLAIEPAARGDETKIGSALDKIRQEDQCFKVSHDTQTKELVISGLGDLHLRVILAKLAHRFKLAINTKQPKIPYRETITAKAEGHYRHKKQTGGAGQFGEVYLRVEPAERNSTPPLQFSWDIFGGSIPGQYEAPIVKGIHDVMENGIIAGFHMQDIKVSVYDGKYHPVDSKEVAFRSAGKGAFKDAISKAKPVLLEPIVNLDITIPADYMGDITGDLSSRRGRVQGQEMLSGNMMVLKAQVPLSEVAQYNSQLKSVTGGQGSYSMELSHYEPVPPNVQQQVIAQYKKEETHEEEE